MISALGRESRPVISITYWIGGRKIKSIATVARRQSLPYRMLIGRTDLKGFLINPEVELESA